MNRNVILLGAGASKSEGAPLQNELFKEFLEYYKKSSEGQELKNKKKQDKLIIEFFKEFWGVDIFSDINQEMHFPTFEECLGMLDLAYFRGECFKKFDKKNINNIRNAIVFLIAKILDKKLKGKKSIHKILIKRLEKEKRLKDTTFISLNYDIIIDNVLMDLDFKYHLDYGIEFINYRNKTSQNLIEYNNSILLLKIHGSLNWLYCPTCNQIEITPKRKGAIRAFYKSEKCSYCETLMEPIIIPPTFYKELTNPYIRQIILKADMVLRNAEKIFICGYSFPDTDMHIKYLLKRAELFNNKTPWIYIINNHKGRSEAQREREIQYFKRFFKDKDKIIYTDLSFEDFAKNGIEDDKNFIQLN